MIRLEDVDLTDLNVPELRRHRDCVLRVLARGVPDVRLAGLREHLEGVRGELARRAPSSRTGRTALLEAADFRDLVARYRSLTRRLGVDYASSDLADLERQRSEIARLLVLTPSQWGWLRRRAEQARGLTIDLGAGDLDDVERYQIESRLLRAVETGWTLVDRVMAGTQHAAVRATALESYQVLGRAADAAVLRVARATKLRDRWRELYARFERALPEAS